MSKKKKANKEKILTMFLIIVVVMFLFSITSDIPKNITKSMFNRQSTSGFVVSSADKKKNALKETYSKLTQYEKNSDYTSLYEFLTPIERYSITLNDYVRERNSYPKIYDLKYTVISIEVYNDIGVVDRIVSYCKIENCTDAERISSKNKKQYFYINEKWYHNLDDNLYCNRFEKYSMPEEFDRAVSLIIQRMKQSVYVFGNQTAKDITDIYKCLDIQYAQSDDEMHGAEGLFMFSSNSTADRLQIFVSPRYQIKDDLLTAILLSHEITHAYLFATGTDKVISCYENEATAFSSQMRFLGTLNMEEISSITYRYNNRSSQEVMSVVNLIVSLGSSYGTDGYQKALNYVENNPFYQKQCSK